jgi:acyl-CoA thioester hydrolase
MSPPPGLDDLRPAAPSPLSASMRLRVRYCECDPARVAHHAAYAPWLEMARTEILRCAGVTYADLEASGFFFVVTRLEIRYRRPIMYDDVIDVHARLADPGPARSRVRLAHAYEITLIERGDRDPERPLPSDGVLATARTELAGVDRTGRLRQIPDWLDPPRAPEQAP